MTAKITLPIQKRNSLAGLIKELLGTPSSYTWETITKRVTLPLAQIDKARLQKEIFEWLQIRKDLGVF